MAKAVVLGGTGAVGQDVVGQLLISGYWATVVTLGRRQVTVPERYGTAFKTRLDQRVINMDNMEQEAGDAFDGATTVFCTLGTTRADAGSAAQFKKVDYEYVAKSAELAARAKVPHYSLLTAQGANANVWASDLKIFHGLLYAKTKGMAEEAVKKAGFERVSIYRPGLINRGEHMRPGEKLAMKLSSSITTTDIAKLMVLDAQRSDPDLYKPFALFTNSAMHKAAAAGMAPTLK